MIHIVNPQTSEILDYITLDNIIEDTHKKSLESYIETYDAIVLGGDDFSYDKHLEKRNHIIIPDEDGTYQEFILFEVDKYRDTEGRKTHFYAHATYLELKKAKVIYPARREGFTLSQHAGWALNDTGWTVGIVESEGVRTFNIENHTNPYEFIKRLANEFEVELRFRVEHDGRRITARYVDFLERIGDWKGREVEFGKDLDSIRRIEKQDIVTALLGLGPEREDGTRLEVLVEDEEALQRWGRVDEHGNLHHLIEPYEIQSDRQEMTEEEARQYTRTALDKRINTQVTYETTILDLEEVPGLEHEKIRFGDTIRIKDTYFNPPLYLEARVYEIERSIKSKAKKDIKLGDYVEYTEEEVNAIWNQLRNEIRRRLDRIAIVSINSSAGNVFKNAQGETELTARTFVNGAERDEDGTLYDYQWMRFDKDGNHDTEFYAEGKTITVKASDIDEKATYRVLVAYELEVINTAEITISNVFDGEPGPPGPKGEDGKTFYTWIKYADTPTSGMSDSPEGKEYIGIAYNKETPTPSTNYDDYIWAKFKGEQGIPGPPGEDGQPTYTWVKYADDEHGNGMSDSPDGKLYIGLAFNKTTPEESNNPADYTWSLMPQNIEIGGRNLLKSSRLIVPSSNNPANYPISYTLMTEGERQFYRIVRTNTQSYPTTMSLYNSILVTDITQDLFGQTVTFSFRARASHNVNSTLFFRFDGGSNGRKDLSYHGSTFQITTSWKTFAFTVTIDFSIYNSDLLRFTPWDITIPSGEIDNFYLDLCEFKIELGNKATDWTPAPEDVQAEIDEAKQEAEEAKQEAQQAQTTADGKNTIFRQSSQPSTSGRKIGDVWFDTSRDNLMHVFNGTQWVEAKWGEQSIVANSITANHIKSLVGLNVNDQFIVDLQGNVKFAGSLEGASGTFGEVTAIDGDFFFQDANSQTKYGIIPKTNLITDPSFELSIPTGNQTPDGYYTSWESYTWNKVGTPRLFEGHVADTGFGIMFGYKYIGVNNSNYIRTSMSDITPIKLIAGKTYTFSSHFARYTGSPTPKLRVKLMQYNKQTDTTSTLQTWEQTFPAIANGSKIVRHSITFTLPSDFGTRNGYWQWVEFEILSGNSSWLHVDGVQLVENNYPTIYEEESSLWLILNGMEKASYFEVRNLVIEERASVLSFDNPLWTGQAYPLDTQTITPSKPLSDCMTGWVLQWQTYVPGTGTQNSNFAYTFIHKLHAIRNDGFGIRVPLANATDGTVNKYIYIYDDRIVGHAANGQSPVNIRALTAVYEF